jgi:thymidylate synthase
MNKLDLDYQNLLKDILENGTKKQDRTGTGTLSVFGRHIRHKMSGGFPAITTKKLYFKGVVTELLWFLRGDTNIKYLVDNDCHIWDGDCYSNYLKHYCDEYNEEQKRKEESPLSWMVKELVNIRPLPKEEFINKIKTDDEFAKKWGELGPIYGAQWRSWQGFKQGWNEMANSEYSFEFDTKGIDQIANSINLLKTDPDSRRNRVSAWNVGELDQMTLPPCHTDFQFYTRELSVQERIEWYNERNEYKVHTDFYAETTHQKIDDSIGRHIKIPTRAISLRWNQRSVDTGLGLPFNIASYGLLLEIIAKAVNMVPDELIGNLGDCHIYLNQIDGVQEQLLRNPYKLPKLIHMKTDAFYKSLSEDLSLFSHLDNKDFQLEGYQSHPSIKMPLSN